MSKKKWNVPVSWRMFKNMEIEADTEEEAALIAAKDGTTSDGEYSKRSFEVETDSIEEMQDQ